MQQLGELSVAVKYVLEWCKSNTVDVWHLLGSGANPARHALLQPTGKPVESNGPMRGAGPEKDYWFVDFTIE